MSSGALIAFVLITVLLATATSFAKFSIVLSVMRNALGLGQVPSGLVISALAGALTLYVMAPVAQRIVAAAGPDAVADATRSQAGDLGAFVGKYWPRVHEPLERFLRENAGKRELALFDRLAQKRLDVHRTSAPPSGTDQASAVTMPSLFKTWPAFMLTELGEAFQIALLILLPFVVIDLFIANVIAVLGLTHLPTLVVSLPLKLLLFVAVNGWVLLSEGLVLGYV